MTTAQDIANSAYYTNQGTDAQAAQAAQFQQNARQASPGVGAGLPSMTAPAGAGAAQQGQAGYNPSAGQLHTGTPSGGAAPVFVNPATGGYSSIPGRDKEGNLVLRPGETGFQTSQQRVNLDPYAQQLATAGNQLMQRGLNGTALAGMPQIQADRMRAAQIDQSGFNQQAMAQNQLARQGNQAIGLAQQAAMGQAPSAAAIQQAQGLDAAQQQAMAMAASARGGADQRAAAMRQGQMAGAQLGMQGVQQAAALRANEMANARGQLVGAIGQQQGLAQQQGVNSAALAGQQAGFAQQAGLANQGTNMQAQLANQQGYLAGTGMDQSTLGMGAGLYQAGAGLGMQGVDYNNQANQTDFNQQQAMIAAANGVYGIQTQADSARYAADKAANAAMTGALINAGGQVVGASMQAFSPQQPRKY